MPAVPAVNASPVAPPALNPALVASLTAMGFPEAECRAALTAAQGNPDLAVEFLMSGIPATIQQPPAPVAAPRPAPAGGPLDALRQHPQFNQLKQLVQSNPAAITQVMDLIGRQNPQLLELIHENHDAFVNMMNEPVEQNPAPPAAVPASLPPMVPMGGGADNPSPQQVMQLLGMLPPEQRAQVAASMGMSPEQLQALMQMMSSMPPEQLAAMTGGAAGAGDRRGGQVVHLTQEEMDAVHRLMELGFSQQEAAQAFLACDRNEAMAANLLFEGGWTMEEDYEDPEGY